MDIYIYFLYYLEVISLYLFFYVYYFPFVSHFAVLPIMKLLVNLSTTASSLKLTWLRVINLVLVFSPITQTDGAFSRVEIGNCAE